MPSDDEAKDIRAGLTNADVELIAHVDAVDIVKGLGNNDELLLTFLCEVIDLAESGELRERLAERLVDWDEDHKL